MQRPDAARYLLDLPTMPSIRPQVLQRIRNDGFGQTVKAVLRRLRSRFRRWSDAALDRRYGIDTCGVIEPEELDSIGEHAEFSTGHEPIQPSVFTAMFRSLPLEHPEYTFIDFGSGKGRAVIMAAHLPFRHIIGVEFSPTLHAQAQRNLSALADRHPRLPPVALYCMDATLLPLPATPFLCFFYNPFGPVVLNKVLDNLEHSYMQTPRPLHVFYRNPVHASVIESRRFLEPRVMTPDFRIYSAVGSHA